MPHRLVTRGIGNRRLPGENPGLVLERLAPPLSGQQEYGPFVEALARMTLPPAYTEAFRRWQRRTPPGVPGRKVVRLKATSPLAIGLGEPVPGENGLTTLSPYGVPIIPGSAIKGVVRAYARSRFAGDPAWGDGGSELRVLLGEGGKDGESGAVDFLDAWIEPDPEHSPFVDDVITAHAFRYYQSEGNTPPDGFDGPNPVHFAAVRGRFRLVLEGPEQWLVPATELVLMALDQHGIGAKTRAGYGRLLQEDPDRYDAEALRQAEERREQARIAQMPPAERLAELERRYAGRSAELEAALDAFVLEESSAFSELKPGGLFHRDDPDVRLAFARRLRAKAERWASKDSDRARRFVAIVRSWLPTEVEAPPSAVVVDATLREQIGAASTLGALVSLYRALPGFAEALDRWGKRQEVGEPFGRLDEPTFRAANGTKREVAEALGREGINALPDGASIKGELRKLAKGK